MKIGILGGTFNPIHRGHIELAEIALKECGLDTILVMPSGISYLKTGQDIPDGKIRLEMCRLAIKDHEAFQVSDLEIKRQGNTYTYETLETLKKIYPSDHLFFMIGADSLYNISGWKYPERIFSACTLVCSPRGTESGEELKHMSDEAHSLEKLYQGHIKLLSRVPADISSTKIRELFKDGASKDDICAYMPEEEYDYIVNSKLYIN